MFGTGLPADGPRASKRRCFGVLQKIFTTGRFPLNGVIAHGSRTTNPVVSKADDYGVRVGEVVFRPSVLSHGDSLLASGTHKVSTSSVSTCNIASLKLVPLSGTSAEIYQAAFAKLLDLSTKNGNNPNTDQKNEIVALMWCIMSRLLPIKIIGVSETHIDNAMIGRSDPSLTTNLDGCVMLTAEERMRAGDYIAVDYPYGEIDIRQLRNALFPERAGGPGAGTWPQLTPGSNPYTIEAAPGPDPIIDDNTGALKCLSDWVSATKGRMRVVKYNGIGYPIGMCLHGTDEPCGFIQARIYTKHLKF